jgi:cytidyltransferase-like protein
MYAHELYENPKPRVIVTYPGRFQPFHQGHAGVFSQLQKKFGAENVFIATSKDQSSAKSPFNFSDKYQLMTAAGVPADKIIQTNAMYALPEGIDPYNTIFITAVGAPDADRLNPDSVLKRDKKDKSGNIIKAAGSPGSYKKWDPSRDPVSADQHGYVIVIPEIKKSIRISNNEF